MTLALQIYSPKDENRIVSLLFYMQCNGSQLFHHKPVQIFFQSLPITVAELLGSHNMDLYDWTLLLAPNKLPTLSNSLCLTFFPPSKQSSGRHFEGAEREGGEGE